MRMLYRLSPIVTVIFCWQLAFADNMNLQFQIDKISQVALSSNTTNYDYYEKQLLQLVKKGTTAQDRGAIFAAIAKMYGHNIEKLSEKIEYYAKAALNEKIGALEACDLYLLLGNVREAKGRRENGTMDSTTISNCATLYVRALDLVLDHVNTNSVMAPPPVGKFDVAPMDPQYQNVVSQHEEQIIARNKILEQNQLVYFRDEFKRRLLLLYPPGSPILPSLDNIVRNTIGDVDRSERILKFVKAVSPNN